jgi:hypothetical protein
MAFTFNTRFVEYREQFVALVSFAVACKIVHTSLSELGDRAQNREYRHFSSVIKMSKARENRQAKKTDK